MTHTSPSDTASRSTNIWTSRQLSFVVSCLYEADTKRAAYLDTQLLLIRMFTRLVIAAVLVTAVLGQDGASPCNNNTTMESCGLSCEYGLSTDRNGCQICKCQAEICQDVQCPLGKICKDFQLTSSRHALSRCIDPRLPAKCHPPMDKGPCRASISRIYYNSDSDSCQPFIYGGCKGNENNFMTIEDCETFCLPQDLAVDCPPMTGCTKDCEHGYKIDSTNCEICECADSPELQPFDGACNEPLTTCLMDCEHGFKKDLRGCEICECESKPKCPDVMCARHCEYGFQKDENGCDICFCREKPECPDVMCARHCEYGFQKDENGCDICKCVETEHNCSRKQCRMYCKYGFQKDENGCDICKCAEDEHKCSPKQCRMYCEYGFVKDEFGCEICQCREEPLCPEVMCAMYCENGFQKDENGCDICKCAEATHHCSPKRCRMYCEHGFMKDEFQCEICKCAPDPCTATSCQSSQVCVAKRPDDCQNCNTKPFCVAVNNIQKIRVELRFVHDEVDDVDVEVLKSQIRGRVSDILGVDEEYIRGIVVRCQDPETTAVSFYVVSYGYWDLVSAYNKFEMDVKTHMTGTSFPYSDVTFVPEHRTLAVQYYDDPEITDDVSADVTSDTSTVDVGVIVGCTVAGLVGVILLSVVVMFVVKSKKGKHDRPKVSYVRAPEPKSDKADPEKPPLV